MDTIGRSAERKIPFSDYSIRPAADRKEIETALEECDSAYTISVIERKNYKELFEKIVDHAITILVTETENPLTIIGYACMYANDLHTKIAYITLFCIKKEYHKLHLGSSLMNYCFETAINNGMNRIKLEVLKQDKGAIAFYEKMGFVTDQESNKDTIYMSVTLKI